MIVVRVELLIQEFTNLQITTKLIFQIFQFGFTNCTAFVNTNLVYKPQIVKTQKYT